MTDKEIIRNHYIFSTTHELDDDNKFLKEYILNLEHENKLLKDKDEKISEIIEYIKENIKAELLNGSIWIDKYKLLNILESNNQPDYKSAWKELKNKSHYINQHMEDLEELEQKYNLGGE